MPVIRGKVVLILGFVFLTTFLAAVRGLPVRKQRSNSPKERSSKLAEVRQPLGKDGEQQGAGASPPHPLLCPGRLRKAAGHPGLPRRPLCISKGSSIQHVSPRPGSPEPREEKQQPGDAAFVLPLFWPGSSHAEGPSPFPASGIFG